jgi:hypothetical protein
LKQNRLIWILLLVLCNLCASAQVYSDGERESPTVLSPVDISTTADSVGGENEIISTTEETSIDFQKTYERSKPAGKKVEESTIRKFSDRLNYSENDPVEKKKKEKHNEDLNEFKNKNRKKSSGSNFWLGEGGKVVAYTIAIVALIFVIVFLIFRISKGVVKKDAAIASVHSVAATDARNLAAMPIEDMLTESLKSLKQLMEKGLLLPSPEKTNFDYVRELAGTNYHSDFRGTTAFFEQVWYGEYQLDKKVFNNIKNKFSDLQDKLRLGR